MAEPFKKKSDVNVSISIVHPTVLTGLGNMLILHKKETTPATPAPSGQDEASSSNDLMANGIIYDKTDAVSGANYREYTSTDAVETDYDVDSAVAKKAASYFSQESPSDRIAVLSYPSGKLPDALKAFWFNNWVFSIFDVKSLEDAKAVSNIYEANRDHFLVIETDTPSDFVPFVGQDFTIETVSEHKDDIDSALLGKVANKQVGTQNWKFKQLKDVTPDDLDVAALDEINRLHAIAYTTVGGINSALPETTAGTTASGEYIDSLHGDLWIKTNIENRIETLLQTNDKIPYDQHGIDLISSQVNMVLAQAVSFGIIKIDDKTGNGIYTVTTSPRSEQSQKDLSDRHYGGISYEYQRSGAIDTVTVKGTIDADTLGSVLA